MPVIQLQLRKCFAPIVKGKERSIREMVPSFLVVVVCAKILPLGAFTNNAEKISPNIDPLPLFVK